ncbi:MAG: hypothetical protein V3S14_15185 [Anaerolineae bacterium]
MSIIQRLEQLEKARQAQEVKRIAALGRLLRSLTPEEEMALEATLEANLVNRTVMPDIEQRADKAFAKAWAGAAPEDRLLLANGTIVEAW